jgi:beta-glucanase (GH16 family)
MHCGVIRTGTLVVFLAACAGHPASKPSTPDASSATDAGSDAGEGGTPEIPEIPGYKLIWSDEFDGDGAPDESKWNYDVEEPGWVNQELQNYTDRRSENVRIEDGILVIEARRDGFQGHEYSSGRLNSAGKGELTYGRIIVRARLPEGRGTWPAIWMLPTDLFRYATTCTAATGWDTDCDAWPNSGEIDIMEHVGYEPNRVHGTIHCQAYNFTKNTQKSASIMVPDATSAFHDYEATLTADYIEVGVDGEVFFRYENDGKGDPSTWPFNHPFHIILNQAVGGVWGGQQGVDPEVFPSRLEVDYVRLYEPLK